MTRYVYTFLLYLLLPFTPLKLLWRGRKQPEYLQYWRERYGFYSLLTQKPIIWLHCVSVGETRAAAPLVKTLLATYPNYQILLTHTTPTGRATSEQLFGNSVIRVYLPYDVPFAVMRFLKHFKPAIGVLMETELWFNLMAGCKKQAIPLLLINARLSEKSASGYAKLGCLVSEGLQSLSAIAAQSPADAVRLQNLGGNNISVVGNLKFDVVPPQDALAHGQHLRSLLGTNRPVLLAASTREGEEALILDAVAAVNIENLLTIIVPRHPQRFNDVEALLKQRGLAYQKRSTLNKTSNQALNQPIDTKTKCLLGDSMGEMFTYYAACDITFIGGSLLPLGGQNLIEACVMGKPVLIGPHTFNFQQATESAISAGAAKRIQNSADLAQTIQALFKDVTQQQQMSIAAARFSGASTGATARVVQLISMHLTSD